MAKQTTQAATSAAASTGAAAPAGPGVPPVPRALTRYIGYNPILRYRTAVSTLLAWTDLGATGMQHFLMKTPNGRYFRQVENNNAGGQDEINPTDEGEAVRFWASVPAANRSDTFANTFPGVQVQDA